MRGVIPLADIEDDDRDGCEAVGQMVDRDERKVEQLSPQPRAASDSELLEECALISGLRRVAMVSWRDLDDPDAGGSELHCHEVARRWAAVGIEVVTRSSRVAGASREVTRDGYRAVRSSGRFSVFAKAPLGLAGDRRRGDRGVDGLVEIWNGMPFLSPIWWRGPKITFLHHVHAGMWQMTLSPGVARVGSSIESRLAPRLYRRTPVITLSDSSRREIVSGLRLPPSMVSVVPPGIDAKFSPAGPTPEDRLAAKSVHPLVVAVGRLVPVKQFDRLISAAAPLAALHPGLEIVVVGEGYERPALEAAIRNAGVGNVVRLVGRVDDDELVSWYRRAWLLVSTSAREGWGMTVTEAAACGTPSIASRIAGHIDAIDDGESGLLFDSQQQLVASVSSVLADDAWRQRLSARAIEQASRFTWDATALATFRLLAAEARRLRP